MMEEELADSIGKELALMDETKEASLIEWL